MHRLPRILRNAATAASLVTCVATAAMWVVSYFAYDAIGFWPSPAQRRAYALISDRGTVCVASLAEGDGRSR